MIYINSDQWLQMQNKIADFWTQDDDPRVTSFGKILRKYFIDELPQLINVFIRTNDS